MPLGRTQTQIIDKLEEMGKLTAEQKATLLGRPDEPTGDQLDDEETEIKDEDLENEESAPIIQLSNRIIEDAYFAGTSDIHIEPWEKEVVVRYRIDGLTQEKLRLPSKVAGALVARFKIM